MSMHSFLGGVFTRFVDFSVIKKGHTFITSTGHRKEEVGNQLIQQAINRWRAIFTTKGAKVCSKFFQSASH